MPSDMREFYEAFYEEAGELLAQMERLLVGLPLEAPGADDLNAIFRAAHSIKGGAATFGFDEMTGLTHVMEELLDRLRKSELRLTRAHIDACLEARDVLQAQLGARKGEGAADPARAQAVTARLRALTGDDDSSFFQELYACLTEQGTPRAEEVQHRDTHVASNSSIRVSTEKVDQLINLVGELVITQSMLAQSAASLDPALFERLHHGLGQLERSTRRLQEAVMAVRMMPIGVAYARFPRVVRDLAQKLGKQVALQTFGEATELDRGLIEKIIDPLTHLVRNSLDHGIEPPERRRAAGKPPKGTITLRAFHQGGSIVIEVADDGAGLDRARILAKAAARGLPAHEAMTDAEVWSLIFEPGFSTAQAVTDVSGRGVGMDVVRRNIQALGGRVEIDSAAGAGTRVTIRLPLTLAILDGMSVAAGGELFVLPLTAIVESLQPAESDLRSVNGRGRVLRVRGEYVPVIELAERFGLARAAGGPGLFVIVEADGLRRALRVDELLGQHQVVIKSLEANYRRVPGISGATVMGDGRVALILDVAALVRPAAERVRNAA